MQSKKQSILLVGAGYLGAHLGNILSPSFEVSYTSKTKKENSISLDILNKETYKNIGQNFYDCIIILASTLQGLGTTELKEDYINLDTLGLSGFLQFVTDNKLTAKLVYISSMTVYGIENDVPVKENSILKPLSTYGLSKLLAENIFSFYCRSHQGSGVILRIPGIYGGDRTSGFVYNTAVKCTKQQAIEINTSSLGYW